MRSAIPFLLVTSSTVSQRDEYEPVHLSPLHPSPSTLRPTVRIAELCVTQGMRLHLLEKDKKSGSTLGGDRREGTAGALKKRRNSFRRSSGSFLRRASRDRDESFASTSSVRKKRSTSYEQDDGDSAADEVGVAGGASLAELEVRSPLAGLLRAFIHCCCCRCCCGCCCFSH